MRFYTDSFNATELRNFNQRFAVACTLTDASTGTTLAQSPVQALIRKQGAGGSASGVKPVCEQSTTQQFVNPKTAAGCDTTASATDTSGPANVGIYACTGALESVVPEVGFSDVGPTEVLEDASGACSDVVGGVVTPFTVPVTTKLRDALQLAQGLSVGSETADNVPSMAASLYTSLTTGLVPRWSDIEVAGTPLTTVTNGTTFDPDVAANYAGGAAPDTRVTLCHRVRTSGTRAQTEVVANRLSCVTGARNLTAPNPFDFAGPTTMPLNSGSSNMSRCLTNMNEGRNYNINQTSLPSDFGSIWALGHQSSEKVTVGADQNEAAGERDGYRMIRYNGVLATYENVANGSYPHYAESTFQWNDSVITNAQEIVAQQIATKAAVPSVLGDAGVRASQTWGETGLLAFGDAPYVGGSYDDTNPATPLTRGGDNCQVAVLNPAFDYAL